MNLALLRARLKELAAELDVLTTKDALTAEDIEALDVKSKEFEDVEKNIAVLEKAEAAKARAALPASTPLETATVPAQAKAAELSAVEKVGLFAVAVAKAKLDGLGTSPRGVLKTLEDAGFAHVAKEFGRHERAMNAGSTTAGGIFVPDEISNEVVPLLRPNSTFLRAGPKRVPFDRGNYHVPAAASGATAYWRGEGKKITVSQPTFKDINLSAKFLGAMVSLTDQLLRWSVVDIKSWVEDDLAVTLAQEVDRAAYFGAGTANEPQGILEIPGIGTVPALGGTAPSVTQIETNASSLELNQMNTNLPPKGLAWLMSPRTFIFLQNIRDGLGNRYFPELQNANPTWRNKPVFVTTTVPWNLGVGTNESILALINFGDVFYGESRSLRFKVSEEGTYINQGGEVVSALQQELMIIRATTEVDVGLRYLEAVQVLEGVQWGA